MVNFLCYNSNSKLKRLWKVVRSKFPVKYTVHKTVLNSLVEQNIFVVFLIMVEQ